MTQKIEGKFYPLQHAEWMKATRELSPSAKDVLYYLRTLDPYSNGIEITASGIARELGIHRSTVSRALKALDSKGFIDLELIRVTVRILGQGMLVTQTVECTSDFERDRQPENLGESLTDLKEQQCCKDTLIDAEQQPTVQKSDRPCSDAPIVAVPQQSEAKSKIQQRTGAPKTIKISEKIKTNQIQDGGENNLKIPEDLIAKLKELSIPLDNRVKSAIASNHISQAYGAIAHIENTWESISNPRGVFLFQIARQPIEPMGSRGKEYKTSDLEGYSLDYLKFMYPNSWKEAAIHFGIDLSQERSNNSQLQKNL
jgi:DNA-binding transcriptional regulator YhcF (GntR family)